MNKLRFPWAMAFAFLAATFVLMSLTVAAETEHKPISKNEKTKTDCQSSREFVTTLEYLRSKEEFSLDERTNQALAHHVSKGCSGAAKRFISALDFLLKLEVGSRNALSIAKAVAHKSDSFVKTFTGIFKRAYAKDFLNLDLMNSYQIARELSLDYKGDVDRSLTDFTKIAAFCSKAEMGLSKPRCAQLGIKIARAGEKFDKPLHPAFISTYRFARDTMKAPINEALLIAHDVSVISPDAFSNFKVAYKYATKNKGLDLNARSSLQFAMEMSYRTIENNKGYDWKDNRLPASK